MRILLLGASILSVIAACGPSEPSQTVTTVAENVVETAAQEARLNAFFEDQFNKQVARSPMTQTYLGIKTDYDKWDDPSDAFAQESLQLQRDAIAEMRESFDFDTLPAQAQTSYRLAEYQLERAEAAFRFRNHGYLFNQMFGAQSRIPAFLINQHKVTTFDDANAYISRLEGLKGYLGGIVNNTREAGENGILPPRFVFDYVISDAENVIAGDPFNGDFQSPLMEDFNGKIDALLSNGEITPEQHDDLYARANTALIDYVGPAFENVIALLEDQKTKATTDDGAWKLPDGADYYKMRLKEMTTTDMSADEIHDLGLSEVARIHDEMRDIMKTVGFEGDLADFFEFMRTDSQFYKPDTDEGRQAYLTEAEAMINEMKADLPSVFNVFPKADMIVKAVEPFREKSAGKAFYSRPAPDGSRPGTYYANLYRMEDMPTYQMEALAFHEGIPGHHMQIAIAQELEGIPKFRKFGGFTAYTEGWGLYSEYFPKEMGYYKDPYSDFGRLAMEIWRAARLVVDTGLHHKKWTREEAVQYLLDNTPNPPGDAQKAIDRYIVMPGQATAYKIGMLKILALREAAKEELGDAFDIRAFHDVVLKDGAVPLAILEENVNAWVVKEKAAQ